MARRCSAGPHVLGRDAAGSVAIWAAAALPALVIAAGGAAELGLAMSDRGAMQDAADAAALAGAGEMAVAPPGAVKARAESYVLSSLTDLRNRAEVSAKASLLAHGEGLRVEVVSRRKSLFGRLLARDGFATTVKAEAKPMARTPLCVVGLSGSGADVMALRESAAVLAPGCALHSNRDIAVSGSAKVQASAVQAVGSATGAIDPEPLSGAETLPDPFASRRFNVSGCGLLGGVLSLLDLSGDGTRDLPAGAHCNNVRVRERATLRLGPGEHSFMGDLEVGDDATVEGEDVVLFFPKGASLKFRGKANVHLKGRKTGPNAGLLLVATRDNTEDFAISSDSVRVLEGVIYMPASRLLVTGTGQVAQQSKWTVTVTNSVQVSGSPTLVINNDYAGSTVPVPKSLKPGPGPARLVR